MQASASSSLFFNMFTPPPSPMPFPKAHDQDLSPEALALETPSEYPFPSVPGPSRTPSDFKKRAGRRTLLFVALLPAALIITASLRHFFPLPALHDSHLERREPQSLAVPSPASSAPPGPATPTSAVPSIPSDPTLPTPFPQPFDTLPSNFSTQGCAAFFTTFLQNPDFRQCRSFSFLLNASSDFLLAQRNLSAFNAILSGTCNTVRTADACATTMSDLLNQLTSVCAQDLSDQNQAALQAQIGFQSYTAMRNAACLQNPASDAYCYLEAVAATPPEDIYFYALPLGTPVPNSTQPSCSACVRSVLSQYAQWVDASNGGAGSGAIGLGTTTGNSSASAVTPSPLPELSKTYPAAARLAVAQCGGTYASVGVAQQSGALGRKTGVAWGAIMLGVPVLVWWAL